MFCFFLPRGMWDLSSPTKDRTHIPYLEGKVLTTGPSGKSYLFFLLIPHSSPPFLLSLSALACPPFLYPHLPAVSTSIFISLFVRLHFLTPSSS